MWAVGSICADAATTPLGWMPGAKAGSGKNSGSTFAKATRAFGTRIRVFFGRSELAIHHDGRGGALLGPIEVGLIFREGKIARFGFIGGREPG